MSLKAFAKVSDNNLRNSAYCQALCAEFKDVIEFFKHREEAMASSYEVFDRMEITTANTVRILKLSKTSVQKAAEIYLHLTNPESVRAPQAATMGTLANISASALERGRAMLSDAPTQDSVYEATDKSAAVEEKADVNAGDVHNKSIEPHSPPVNDVEEANYEEDDEPEEWDVELDFSPDIGKNQGPPRTRMSFDPNYSRPWRLPPPKPVGGHFRRPIYAPWSVSPVRHAQPQGQRMQAPALNSQAKRQKPNVPQNRRMMPNSTYGAPPMRRQEREPNNRGINARNQHMMRRVPAQRNASPEERNKHPRMVHSRHTTPYGSHRRPPQAALAPQNRRRGNLQNTRRSNPDQLKMNNAQISKRAMRALPSSIGPNMPELDRAHRVFANNAPLLVDPEPQENPRPRGNLKPQANPRSDVNLRPPAHQRPAPKRIVQGHERGYQLERPVKNNPPAGRYVTQQPRKRPSSSQAQRDRDRGGVKRVPPSRNPVSPRKTVFSLDNHSRGLRPTS